LEAQTALIVYYDTATVFVREICNGALAISAFVVFFIFCRYVVVRIRQCERWWRDELILAAGAIAVLIVGHFIRALSQWMQFMWIGNGWGAGHWANAWTYFTISTAIILFGKMMMIAIFSPWQRWCLVASTLILAIGLPTALAVFR